MKRIVLIMLTLLTTVISFVGVQAATVDSGTMVFTDDISSGVFDIKGYHEGVLKATTYRDDGYGIDIKVDGQTYSVPVNLGINEVVTVGGLDFKFNITLESNNNYVKIEYTLMNSTGADHIYSIGTYADVKIGNNDSAQIDVVPTGLLMLEGDETQAQFSVILSDSYGVTDVDAFYVGIWSGIQNYAFSQSTIDSFSLDSGFTFSWNDRTITDGESIAHSVMFGIGEVNTSPVISSDQTGDLGEFTVGDSITLSGSVSDVDGDNLSLYYSVNGETYTSNPITVDGSGNYSFTLPAVYTGNVNTLQLVLVDEPGAMTTETLTYTSIDDVDTEAPIITASNETVNTEDASTWSPTYSAMDDTDGNVTSTVQVTYLDSEGEDLADLNAARVLLYANEDVSVNYQVSDVAGNSSNKVVTITANDNTLPAGNAIADQTMEINGVVPNWSTLVTATDNSNGTVTITVDDSAADYSQVGSYQIDVELEDESGNTYDISFNVNVVDTIAPTFDDIEDQTIEAGSTPPLWANLIVNAEDNSNGMIATSYVDVTVQYDVVGIYEVIVSAQDVTGNITTKSFNVNVVDTTPPTFDEIAKQYVEVNSSTVDWTTLITNVSDNASDSFTYTVEMNTVDYTVVSFYSVTVRVTDESGNYSERTFDVEVEDTIAPTGNSVEDQTMEINGIVPDWTELITSTSDNSNGEVTVTAYDNLVDYTQVGSYMVTLGLVDETGNASYIYFNVNIEDTIAPTFDDIEDQTVSVGSSAPNWGDLVQNTDDNSNGALVWFYNDSAVDYDTVGSYEVSVTVRDSSGNETTKTFNVFIGDPVAPTFDEIETQNVEIFSTPIDWKTLIVNANDNVSTNLTYTVESNTVDYTVLGTYSVTVRVADEAGNYTDKTFSVIVEDTTAPTGNSVEDQTHEVNGLIDNWALLITSTSDNSNGDVTVTVYDSLVDYSQVGTYLVTLGLEDESGNTSYIYFNLNVVDTTAPVFDDIQDQTVEVARPIPTWNHLIQNMNDNSGVALASFYDDSAVDYNTVGTYEVSVTVEDSSGNSTTKTFNIVVEDTTAPTFDSIEDQTIEAGVSVIDWATLVANIADNSNGDVVITYVDTVDYDTTGRYTITVRATDESGNYTEESFDVVVEDTTAPTFSDVTIPVFEAGDTPVDINITIHDATDNSDGYLVITYDDATVDYDTVGTYMINVTATDESGNATTHSIAVSVEDTIVPTFDDIADQSIEAGSEAPLWNTLVNNMNDNSDGSVTITNEDTVDYDTPGTYSVTITVADESGNETIKSFNVVVADTTAPTFDNVDSQTIEAGTSTIDWTTLVANILDNSDGTTTVTVEESVDYDTTGTYAVKVKVTDESNNYTEKTFNVVVEDTTAPTFDDIENEIVEAGISAIDWATLVTNINDNSDSTLIITYIDTYFC